MPNLHLDANAPGDIKADHPVGLIAFILIVAVVVIVALIVRKRKK